MKIVKLDELLVIVFESTDLNSRNLYESIESIYEEIDQHKLFILDLSNIKHLNTEAAGSLIYLQKKVKDNKKSIRMYQTKEQIMEVYHKLNLDNVMSIMNRTPESDSENTVYYIN